MAKGRAIGRFEAILGLVGLLALGVTISLTTGWNPLPSWAAWLRNQTVTVLSTPRPPWTVRAGDQPISATVLPATIVVATDGSVEARNPTSGDLVWSYDDSWAAVAGEARPVVIVGRMVGSGFDVYDAASGARLWDDDARDAVWAYSDMILVLHCRSGSTCTLSADEPTTGHPKWTVPVSGDGQTLHGIGNAFAALVPLKSGYTAALQAAPAAAPALISLSLSGKVHAISTVNGHEVRAYQPDNSSRVIVADHEELISTAQVRGDSCYGSIEAHDVTTGALLWRKPGYDAGTASGLDCDQRRDPYGGGISVLTTDPSGRDALLDVRTGNVMYRAKAGDHVIATDGAIALVRNGDTSLLRVIDLSKGKELYTRVIDRDTLVGLAPTAVLIADPAADKPRMVALDRFTGGPVLDVPSAATVLGIGPATLIINIGRSFGPLTLTAPA